MGRNRRKPWAKGRHSVGEYGSKVYLRERGKAIHIGVHVGGGKQEWKSLGHNDRARAVQQALEVAAALLTNTKVALDPGRITVGQLFDRYRSSQVMRAKCEQRQKENRRHLVIWEDVLGVHLPVRDIRASHLSTNYIPRRRAGGMLVPGYRPTVPVRNQVLNTEIRFLMAVLNWGASAFDNGPDGQVDKPQYITTNPLKGYRPPVEAKPRRPIVDEGYYEALMGVADQVHELLPTFLTMINALGWRVGSICTLSMDRFDLPRNLMLPLGEKGGEDGPIPIPPEVRAALRSRMQISPLFGSDWIFPSRIRSGPWRTDYARKLHNRVAALAGVEYCGGWHAFRRKRATEMKMDGVPSKDGRRLMGWKSAEMWDYYTFADSETLVAAVERKSRLRFRGTAV